MTEITYDIVSHLFFCEGHVDRIAFLLWLWETWDTDWCAPDTGVRCDPIRQSYARWIDGKPGYWEETGIPEPGAIPITCVDGEVINLGPERCIYCKSLMHLVTRQYLTAVREIWSCPVCGSQAVVARTTGHAE